MKIKKQYTLQAAAAIVAALCCTSCSDTWDDHYSEASEGIINTTLWEAINSDQNLTHFAKVVKACGYDVNLGGSQTYTVFAPTNSSLTEAQADSMVNLFNEKKAEGVKTADNPVVQQFLKNHIALFKHSVSSLTGDSLTMMNSKYQPFTASSIGGNSYTTKNVLYNNGVLYTIGGQLTYEPNILEYLAMDNDLDSVYKFINSYGHYIFNASQSVPGEIVDGKTQYLDSVTVYNNELLNKLGDINREDSTYLLLAPTNSEWKRLVDEYTPYFNYDAKVDDRDSLQYANARIAILYGAVFNRNKNTDAALQDSAVSTSALSDIIYDLNPTTKRYCHFYKPFAAGGIFEGTKLTKLSNGEIRKASDFRISKFDTFAQEQIVEAESTFDLDTLSEAIDPVTVRTVNTRNPFYGKVSGNSFVEVVPEVVGAKPSITYKVSNVLSNLPYDIYAVFVPALAYDTLATAEQRLPVRFRAQVGYQYQGSTKWERNALKTTTADVVDTVLVKSNYKFPTTSYGLSDAQAKVRLYTDVPSNMTSKYTNTMRIDCIIVKPHDAEAASKARTIKIKY